MLGSCGKQKRGLREDLMPTVVVDDNQVPDGNKSESLSMTAIHPVLFSPENAEVCARLSAGQQERVRDIISRTSDKWSLWTLSVLASCGTLRFSRLLERVRGVSQKSLTVTLRQLERDGLITRTVMVKSPIRVDYAATPLGIDLIRHVDPLWTWVALHQEEFAKAREQYEADQAR